MMLHQQLVSNSNLSPCEKVVEDVKTFETARRQRVPRDSDFHSGGPASLYIEDSYPLLSVETRAVAAPQSICRSSR